MWSVFAVYSHLKTIKRLFETDKLDFIVWSVAWIAVMVFDIPIGIFFGLIACFIAVIVRSQVARTTVLVRLGDTEIYNDGEIYDRNSTEMKGIKIVKFLAPLIYCNRDTFRRSIENKVGISQFDSEGTCYDIHTIVLDCSAISHVDYGGLQELVENIIIYKQKGIHFDLACLNNTVLSRLIEAKDKDWVTLENETVREAINSKNFFPTIHDAVCNSLLRNSEERSKKEQVVNILKGLKM